MVQYENPVTSPASGQTIANSQPKLLADFQYLKAWGAKDHNFSSDSTTSSDGYHTDIHFIKQAPPSAISQIGQLFVADGTGGTDNNQLYFLSQGNILSQLTTAITPVLATNGITYLPGGLVLQWGQATKNTGGTVNFLSGFGATPYSIQTTILENSSSRFTLYVQSISGTSSFNVACRDSGGNDTTLTFSWMAIGTS